LFWACNEPATKKSKNLTLEQIDLPYTQCRLDTLHTHETPVRAEVTRAKLNALQVAHHGCVASK
jgi:hypothetical protein